MKIKFLTLNILDGGKFFDNIVTFIKGENPDLIALQEVYKGGQTFDPVNLKTIDALKEKLSYPYSAFSPTYFFTQNNKKIDAGNLLLSRYPLQPMETVFFDSRYEEFDRATRNDWNKTPMGMQHVIAHIQPKLVDVFNIHGIWETHGKDTAERLKMSEAIVNEINNKEHIILAGDFNVRPDTENNYRKSKKSLHNVFKGELTTSFNMKHKPQEGGFKNSVVDMIFVSRSYCRFTQHHAPQMLISPTTCRLSVTIEI
jgi:endonuclease/exonuclease/phosphatase family metal-dependent hydrolase